MEILLYFFVGFCGILSVIFIALIIYAVFIDKDKDYKGY